MVRPHGLRRTAHTDSVSRRWDGIAELLRDSAARSLETIPFVSIINVGIQQRCDGGGPGIVDEHGDRRFIAQRRFDLHEIHLVIKGSPPA